ncbi:MAG: YraN family protein [Acidimicrobiia bacterium]
MSSAAQARGAYGERRAAQWYQRQGYSVLARNWRNDDGELDLIVARSGLVVFVEVKARAATRFGIPAEAVTAAKARRIRRLAARWLAAHPQRGVEVRFDVVSVLGTELSVIEGAL